MSMPEQNVCESVVRQLWPYLDEVVSDVERERIFTHLGRCSWCVSQFEFAQAFLDAVEAAGASPEAREPLRARVLDALAAAGFTEST